MPIVYLPSKLLKTMAPAIKAKALVTNRLTVNQVALRSLARTGILKKDTLEDIALNVINQYKDRKEVEIDDGATVSEATEIALNDKALMVQRVQNAAVQQITKKVKVNYGGEDYIWLPSDADEPDPVHQLNYGLRFTVGVGEAPGDRYGCQCGMKILTDEDTLEL